MLDLAEHQLDRIPIGTVRRKVPELPDKGDVSDWLDAGHTVEELQSIVRVSSREFVPHLESVNLSDVTPEEIRWLWQNRIPRGKLTVIAGVPGVGKSFATLDIASWVSSGTPWPDRRNEINLPGNVVILSAEDDPADTIRPRVDATGGDPSRFAIIKGVQAEEDEQSRMFKLDRDLQLLEQHIRCAKARLAIIDPISAYLGKTDSHKDAEIRGVLLPLSEIAAGNRGQ